LSQFLELDLDAAKIKEDLIKEGINAEIEGKYFDLDKTIEKVNKRFM
jgi:hypothetical protein